MSDKHQEVKNTEAPDNHERRAVSRMSDEAHGKATENVASLLPKDSPYTQLVASAGQPERHPGGTVGFYKDVEGFNKDVAKALTDGAPKETLQQMAMINDHLTQAIMERTKNLTSRFANAQMNNDGALQVNPVG